MGVRPAAQRESIRLIIGGGALRFGGVISLLRMPREFRHVFGRIDLYSDFTPGPIKVPIRRRVADRVVISQVVGDVFDQFFDFVQSLRKEGLTTGKLGELYQIFLRLLRGGFFKQSTTLIVFFE